MSIVYSDSMQQCTTLYGRNEYEPEDKADEELTIYRLC